MDVQTMDPYKLFHGDSVTFENYMSLDLVYNRTRKFMEYVLDNMDNNHNAKIYDTIMRERSYDYIALLYLRGYNVKLSSKITISWYSTQELIKLCHGTRILVHEICKSRMYDVADQLDDSFFIYSSSDMLLYLLYNGRSLRYVDTCTSIPNNWDLYELYKLNKDIIKKIEISNMIYVKQIYRIKEFDPNFDIPGNVNISGINRKEIYTVLGIKYYDVPFSTIANYIKYLPDGYITTPPHLHYLKNRNDIDAIIRKYSQVSIFISASQHDIYYLKYLDINFKPPCINLGLCNELVLISKHGLDISNINVLIDDNPQIKNMTDLDYITLVRSGINTVYIQHVFDILSLVRWMEYFPICEFEIYNINSQHMNTDITSDVLNYRVGIRKLLELRYMTPAFYASALQKNAA